MKLIYKPFGIVISLLAGFLSKKVFSAVWGIFDDEEPPKPTTRDTNWPKVLGAAAVQGIAFSVTKAAVNRTGAKTFAHLTGAWPGEERPDKSQAASLVR
jgi:hypothetical protein